jgi:hypothetical protein
MYTTSNSSPLALWNVIRFRWPGEPPCPANCVTDQPAKFFVGSHRPRIPATFEASSASIGSLANNARGHESSSAFNQSRRLSLVSPVGKEEADEFPAAHKILGVAPHGPVVQAAIS